MALVLKDRVRVTSTTTGTGTFTLGAASAGFQDFSVIGDGNITYYAIQNSADNTWEVGLGTYTSSGTTLSRDTVLESSNSGSLVNFGAGTKDVFVTYPAEKGLYLDASGNAIGLGTPASATLTNATGLPLTTGVTGTLPATNGGTGITSLGTGVATFLGTPSSSNLASAVTDETGTGSLVFATSPTLVTPVLGTPSSGTLTSCTGLPLTTGVTGTLPVANGGTGTSTAFTTGSVVFAGASGTYTQDNANLFWDDSNNSLGIGTATPTQPLDINGNLAITGSARRIIGDFSNATIASRVMFQTNTIDSSTNVYAIPNGTNQVATYTVVNNSTPTNASIGQIGITSTDARLISSRTGTGTYLPLTFYTNGSEAMRIDTSQNVGIGITNPANKLVVSASNPTRGIVAKISNSGSSSLTGAQLHFEQNTIADWVIGQPAGVDALAIWSARYPAADGTERMRITSGGEVYIAGTTDQGAYNLQCNGTGVWGAGAYVNGSDARIKENIVSIDSCLDVVNKLNPVTYKYKEDWSKDQSTQTGFIAQELLVALEGKNYVDGIVQQGGEYMSVAYQNIIPLLTKAIQELSAKVETLEAQLQGK